MLYKNKQYLSSSNDELDESDEVVELQEQLHSEPGPKPKVGPKDKRRKLITTAEGNIIPRIKPEKFTIPKLMR